MQQLEALESRGVMFQEYDLEAMGYADAGTGRIIRIGDVELAFFADPEGNVVNVAQLVG